MLRIYYDEPSLLATSYGFHEEMKPVAVESGVWLGDEFEILGGSLDKRPFLFPFLVGQLHNVSGYRAANVYVLNHALYVVFLVGAYLLTQYLTNNRWLATLVVLLWISLPLLTQVGKSGAFDLLHLVLLQLLVFLTIIHWRTKSTDLLVLLGWVATAFTFVRYENILFLLPVALYYVASWVVEKRIFVPRSAFIWAILVGFSLLHLLNVSLPNKWEEQKLYEYEGHFLQVGFLFTNLRELAVHMLNLDGRQPGAVVFALFGVVALILFLVGLRKRLAIKAHFPLIFWVFVLGGHALFLLLYRWSVLSEPTAFRLSLPIWLFLALAITGAYLSLHDFTQSRRALIACNLVVLLSIVFLTIPHHSSMASDLRYVAGNIYREKMAFAKAHKDESYLAIDAETATWTTIRVTAAKEITLNLCKLHFAQETGWFESIYIFENVITENKAHVSTVDKYQGKLSLELMSEKQIHPIVLMRVWRVNSIDVECPSIEQIRESANLQPDSRLEELPPGILRQLMP